MLVSRLRSFAVALTALAVPVTLSAQDGSSVTVAPLSAGAPVLGWPGLGALAIALAAVAVALLRRPRPLGARTLGLVAVVLTAAVGQATVSHVTISGEECREVTEKSYAPLSSPELHSECSNPIRIVALDLDCDHTAGEDSAEPVSDSLCEVGLIVPPAGSCRLPACPC